MNINQYHTNLFTTLAQAFPVLQTVAAYRIGETLATPAVLVEVDAMAVGKPNGLGKTPVTLSLALHCILGHGTPNLELEVRNFAAQVLVLLHNNFLGFDDDIDAPANIQAQPGEIKPGKGGFESMVVTFDQTVYLGEPAFDLSGTSSVELRFNNFDDEVIVK